LRIREVSRKKRGLKEIGASKAMGHTGGSALKEKRRSVDVNTIHQRQGRKVNGICPKKDQKKNR